MWIDSGMEVDEHESGRREDVMGGREWRRPVGQQGTADAAGAGKSTGQCLLLGGNSAPLKPLPEPRQSAKFVRCGGLGTQEMSGDRPPPQIPSCLLSNIIRLDFVSKVLARSL